MALKETGGSMRLSNENILVILFVGLVAGWLAGKIVRGTGFGIIGDILVGIAGALIASFIFPKLGIHLGTPWYPRSSIRRSARSCFFLPCGSSEAAAVSDRYWNPRDSRDHALRVSR
jgi:uncharacterized membrane protein YeaQ/YmgE (transglycosylase-associated protein family)